MQALLLFLLSGVILGVRPQEQLPLREGKDTPAKLPWNIPPDSEETDQWIFHSVSGHLRHWPNTLYRNGHSITPGTILPGTLMYHGRAKSNSPPPGPEWLSFDPEHSYMFGRSLYTYVVGEESLKVLYFDGSSASNMITGTIDTQELVLHGEIRKDGWKDEWNRIGELCDWGKEFGLDGFLRMEFDFEVMLCNFTQGIHLVSSLDLLPANMTGWGPSKLDTSLSASQDHISHTEQVLRRQETTNLADQNDSLIPGDDRQRQLDGPWKEPPTPPGWKGTLRNMVSFDWEAIQAGNWHNKPPGVNGVVLDHSGMVTFFDPKYKSLVEARRGVDRKRWRAGNITKEDFELFNEELRDVLTRKEKGSGVKWDAIVQNIVLRHAKRLEFLSDWLGDETHNSTYRIKLARRSTLTILSPYLALPSIPANYKSNTTWLDAPMYHCSTSFTSHLLPAQRFTVQEHRIRRAVETVMREICRTLGIMWIDAFDAEQVDEEEDRRDLLAKWKGEVDRLMAWLAWTEWVKCDPPCGKYEMCSLPQWPFNMRWFDPEPEISYTPVCMSRLELDLGGPKEWD